MNSDPDSESFYDRVPVFRGFPRVMDETLYRPLPQDWVIGTTDVVGSTRAIRRTATRPSTWRVSRSSRQSSMPRPRIPIRIRRRRRELRGAAIVGRRSACGAGRDHALGAGRNVARIARRHGADRRACERTAFDVRIARFGPSENVNYAMFMGGGLAWAEAAMKQGSLRRAASTSPERAPI